MHLFSIIMALIVAIEHFYIMGLEMFFPTSETAQKSFGLSKEVLADKNIQTLFANQGLYNGFLAAGIIWGLFFVQASAQTSTVLFFVACVIIAALYGALTSSKQILLKQGLPAIIAFIVILIFK